MSRFPVFGFYSFSRFLVFSFSRFTYYDRKRDYRGSAAVDWRSKCRFPRSGQDAFRFESCDQPDIDAEPFYPRAVLPPCDSHQYHYALPPGTLYIRKAKYKQGTWCDLQRGYFNDVEARAAQPGVGPPRTFSLWQNARVERFVGTVEATEFDEQRNERHVTFNMSHTEGGVRIGDLVFNLSAKHAEAVITGNIGTGHSDSTTRVRYSALQGGTRDRFEVGDQIRITSPHTSGHAILIAPAPVRTDEQGDESIAAFVARRHRVITRKEIDNENDSLELDDEFNDTLMYEILHWARVQRMGLDTTAQLYRRLSNEEYLIGNSVGRESD